jgi:hypothetical protein
LRARRGVENKTAEEGDDAKHQQYQFGNAQHLIGTLDRAAEGIGGRLRDWFTR